MSHFSVAVFTDENTTVEDLLEPFCEDIKVEKYIAYTKEQVIENGKKEIKSLKSTYKKYMNNKRAFRRNFKNNVSYLRFIKKVPLMLKWDDERIYKFALRYYSSDKISEDGGIYSTYNPNSKWDWYTIGRKMEKRINH